MSIIAPTRRARRRLALIGTTLVVLLAACELNPQPLPPRDDDDPNNVGPGADGGVFAPAQDSGSSTDPNQRGDSGAGLEADASPTPPDNLDAGADGEADDGGDAGDAGADEDAGPDSGVN